MAKRTSRLHPAVLAWIKRLASKGGKSRARSLTARQRQAIARLGGQAAVPLGQAEADRRDRR